ncbi:hypothetical protein CRM22_004846 [Opisthorchis felineus]|uniref:Uncharacterized protein n=1 Tax=Opisthorchis felineus TaxID=147828 RepID=A0A4S2LU46_OPIFE|nr:hypothetical protein CRM22_004846 [Opisthorchis felineus]
MFSCEQGGTVQFLVAFHSDDQELHAPGRRRKDSSQVKPSHAMPCQVRSDRVKSSRVESSRVNSIQEDNGICKTTTTTMLLSPFLMSIRCAAFLGCCCFNYA